MVVREALIVEATRSPIGKRGGALASLRADELAGQVLTALLEHLQTLADCSLYGRWYAGNVNPNSGGISLGHPLQATGARITATLPAELERREARYGRASMCIGQGQAIAAVIERL